MLELESHQRDQEAENRAMETCFSAGKEEVKKVRCRADLGQA